ncbi:MAG: serine hydrolase [Dehalococcoidia bacterium]
MPHHPALHTFLLLALLFAACADGSSDSDTTQTATRSRTAEATPSPARRGETATPIAPPGGGLTPEPTVAGPATSGCIDPYPQGAPYTPEPGEPITIRSTGYPAPPSRYQPMPFASDPVLVGIVRDTLGADAGRFGIVIKNLADGRGVALAPDRVYYAASLFKTWVMLEAFHQREARVLGFDERYTVTDYYAEYGLTAGQLQACQDASVREMLLSMMRISDNVAANMLLDRVNAENVRRALRGMGLQVSTFAGGGSLPLNASDTALLLEAIARRQALSPAASDEMLALLASETYNDRLPALLPAGTRVAHKTGDWENATHDAGIVFSPRATYVIVVLSDFGFSDDGATPIARVSRAVYDYYNR